MACQSCYTNCDSTLNKNFTLFIESCDEQCLDETRHIELAASENNKDMQDTPDSNQNLSANPTRAIPFILDVFTGLTRPSAHEGNGHRVPRGLCLSLPFPLPLPLPLSQYHKGK